MHTAQTGILASVPSQARSLMWELRPGARPESVRELLHSARVGDAVIGLGAPLLPESTFSGDLPPFPGTSRHGLALPSTPAALWIWLRGNDRGELVHETQRWTHLLAHLLTARPPVDAFTFRGNRDLSGYEDGTENPKDEAAAGVALIRGRAVGWDGSSLVAVQRWQHDLDALHALTPKERDDVIGRRLTDNQELVSAPASAHVKRAAQESFSPAAFMLRRSMPWADGNDCGLLFIAFGASLSAFEAVTRRMVGQEDGIVDGLFRFSRPIDGAYFWCPPVQGEHLDLCAVLDRP